MIALLPALAAGCSPQPAAEAGPPNVLLYVIDTLRPDSLGAYGNVHISTHHLDSIAADGVVFENAHANASWTRASMASLFTGLYPTRHKTRTRVDHLQEGIPTLSQIFSEAGYATGFIVANPNVGSVYGFERGFENIIELYQRREPGWVMSDELIATADTAVDEAIGWIQKNQGPFFLVVMPIDPHAPYEPPEGFDRYGGNYVGGANGSLESIKHPKLSPRDRVRIRSLYDGEVAFSDAAFGRLIEYLKDQRRLDDTIVVYTSDHGEEFWEYGRTGHGLALVDTLLHVPLVVRYPRDPRIIAGTREQRAVELVDLLPSLLDLAGLPIPNGLDGRTIFSSVASLPRGTFSQVSIFGQHMSSFRDYPWKLVVDHRNKTSRLYSLDGPQGETRPVSLARNPKARKIHTRLEAELMRIVANEGAVEGPAPDVNAEVPPEVESALRELGYIE